MLTSNFAPTYDVPLLKDSNSQLAMYINALAKNQKEASPFINCVTEFGNQVEFALIAFLIFLFYYSLLKII